MRTFSDNLVDRLFTLLVLVIVVYGLYLAGGFVYSRYWPKETAKTKALIKSYEQRIKDNPNDLNARAQLGQIYISLKRYDDAAVEFKEALKVADDYGPARVGLGLTYLKSGDNEEALTQFQKEINVASKGSQAKIDRFLEQAYYFSGMIYLEEGSFRGAINNFKKSLTISDTGSDTYFHLGEAYEGLDETQQARQSYEKALELDPSYKEAKEALEKING